MIYVWVRATLDWEDEAAFRAQLLPRLRPRVEVWNSTINMPFHIFRHRVRQIATLNHSRIDGARLAEWDEIPDGARVVPVDDDDWFTPRLAAILEREWGSARGVSWNPLWIGIPVDFAHWRYATRRRLLPFTPGHWTCDTNNYGLLKDPVNKPLLQRHELATSWFDGPGAGAVRRIGGRLSVNNRTLGSTTSLRPARLRGHWREITQERLRRRLRRYKRLYRRRWPRDLAWARPYVAMMAELMEELEPR